MVVDDDEPVRKSLCKLLEGEGYHVVSAANGEEALDLFLQKENSPDLLLVDLNMPSKNGWVTFYQVHEVNSSLPVIIITGLPNQSELAEAAGASALVEKPIDVPKLLQLVQKKLDDPVHSSFSRQLAIHHLHEPHHDLPRELGLDHTYPYDHWGINE
jgi:CheY-like chemotaxis protein